MEAMLIPFASPLEGEAGMHRQQAMHAGRGVDSEHSACPLKGRGDGGRLRRS